MPASVLQLLFLLAFVSSAVCTLDTKIAWQLKSPTVPSAYHVVSFAANNTIVSVDPLNVRSLSTGSILWSHHGANFVDVAASQNSAFFHAVDYSHNLLRFSIGSNNSIWSVRFNCSELPEQNVVSQSADGSLVLFTCTAKSGFVTHAALLDSSGKSLWSVNVGGTTMSAGAKLSEDGTVAAILVWTNDDNAHIQLYNTTSKELLAISSSSDEELAEWMGMSPKGAYACFGPSVLARLSNGSYANIHLNHTMYKQYTVLGCGASDNGLVAVGMIDINGDPGWEYEAVLIYNVTEAPADASPIAWWTGPHTRATSNDFNVITSMKFDATGRFLAVTALGLGDVQPTVMLFDTFVAGLQQPATFITPESYYDTALIAHASSGYIVAGGDVYTNDKDRDYLGVMMLINFTV